jgi:hypothetical protein
VRNIEREAGRGIVIEVGIEDLKEIAPERERQIEIGETEVEIEAEVARGVAVTLKERDEVEIEAEIGIGEEAPRLRVALPPHLDQDREAIKGKAPVGLGRLLLQRSHPLGKPSLHLAGLLSHKSTAETMILIG